MQTNDDPPALNDEQSALIEWARRDLDEARTMDLAELSPEAAIFLVERLRGRLDDVIGVLDDLASK